MTEETKIFKRKTKMLNEFWKLLGEADESFQLKDKILQLTKRCDAITDTVSREGSLNAGGKFEWVDSILIKVSN